MRRFNVRLIIREMFDDERRPLVCQRAIDVAVPDDIIAELRWPNDFIASQLHLAVQRLPDSVIPAVVAGWGQPAEGPE